jgi:hypothetical protein
VYAGIAAFDGLSFFTSLDSVFATNDRPASDVVASIVIE